MNSFGDTFTFTSFGESHSAAIGGVLDGVPAGLHINLNLIRTNLDRRAGRCANDKMVNGQMVNSIGCSSRAAHEPDEVEWLSGVIEQPMANGQQPTAELVTLGTPIAFLIRNHDARPEDYEAFKHSFRQGHADSTYAAKYGIRDWRGGGRASARETAARVVAGSLAQQMLADIGITIKAQLVQVGAETNPRHFDEVIARYRAEGDSIGGIIRCEVTGLPAGLGEPIFDKLQAHLAYAILSINACKGFDYGSGFDGVTQPGSIANLQSGGLLGGITDGTTLSFRCVFKPTPSTPKAGVKGRHDTCVAIRAVPVVEAMTALVLANFMTIWQTDCHK